MTRLITEWITDMEEGCQKRDLELKEKTGLSLLELAATAAGKEPEALRRLAGDGLLVAAVPVTSGLGVIGEFAQSVAAIVRTMGFDCFVTTQTDVNGYYEAFTSGADLIFMADDDRFVAINTKAHKISENNQATAAGYVTALNAMMHRHGHTMKDATVLLLGYGPVGRMAQEYMTEKGARVTVFDKDPFQGQPFRPDDIKHYAFLFEATPEAGWLHSQMLHPKAIIAAPGIPLGLDPTAAGIYENRLVHDMLDIGTATMLAMAI